MVTIPLHPVRRPARHGGPDLRGSLVFHAGRLLDALADSARDDRPATLRRPGQVRADGHPVLHRGRQRDERGGNVAPDHRGGERPGRAASGRPRDGDRRGLHVLRGHLRLQSRDRRRHGELVVSGPGSRRIRQELRHRAGGGVRIHRAHHPAEHHHDRVRGGDGRLGGRPVRVGVRCGRGVWTGFHGVQLLLRQAPQDPVPSVAHLGRGAGDAGRTRSGASGCPS